jgi:hypothetical protein
MTVEVPSREVRMLSSNATRFRWARKARTDGIVPEAPLFRLLSRRWQPVLRAKPDAATEVRQTAKSRWRVQPKKRASTWSPWLWVE